MGFRVNQEQCSTCIFGPNSPVSKDRFEDLREMWETDGDERVQTCHHSSIKGGDTGCRGHYEAAKRGEIKSPVDILLKRFLDPNLSKKQAYEIAERMGWIVFEGVDE